MQNFLIELFFLITLSVFTIEEVRALPSQDSTQLKPQIHTQAPIGYVLASGQLKNQTIYNYTQRLIVSETNKCSPGYYPREHISFTRMKNDGASDAIKSININYSTDWNYHNRYSIVFYSAYANPLIDPQKKPVWIAWTVYCLPIPA